jgi:hypothetical protein
MQAVALISSSFVTASMGSSYAQESRNADNKTFEVYALSGKKTVFGPYYVAQSNCSPVELKEAAITKQPEHGKVVLVDKTAIMQYPKDSPRSSCNGNSVKGKAVEYVPSQDYKGPDEVVGEAIANGTHHTYTFKITVK